MASERAPHELRGPRRAPRGDERLRDADRTRRKLLAAGLEEFAAHGFAGTRVADIARRADVDKQLISYYFGGKAGLYTEVMRGRLAQETLVNDPDLPLSEIAVRYLRHNLSDPTMAKLLLWAGLANSAEPLDTLPAGSLDLSSMERRRRRGELADDLDPAAVLLLIIGAVNAPVALPQIVEAIFGVSPDAPEFEERYAEQLRRIVDRLSGPGPS
ncbi:TetR/AcrR family transcriptional regulator [Actinomadura chibensis]|uniref:TetR/AcrR family transcriptional regulator n=1 Tax=Actinomadura chibensis TaxID=392828 RepID=A0A5D0NUQ2_9ACTN|nr:TetR/AcrR family transcriptional regulator [Actinomadura chibensis]TYB47982.1 TetR/AcrR family transcriptional regulator [Actinomadura chibensis]